MENEKDQIKRIKDTTAAMDATNIVIAMISRDNIPAANVAVNYATIFAAVRKSLE